MASASHHWRLCHWPSNANEHITEVGSSFLVYFSHDYFPRIQTSPVPAKSFKSQRKNLSTEPWHGPYNHTCQIFICGLVFSFLHFVSAAVNQSDLYHCQLQRDFNVCKFLLLLLLFGWSLKKTKHPIHYPEIGEKCTIIFFFFIHTLHTVNQIKSSCGDMTRTKWLVFMKAT